jgi:putative ABC transport system substrate-binding protein
MERRTFLALLPGSLLAAPLAAEAQQAGKIPRVGVLWHAGSADEEGSYYTGLLEGFRNLGYVDGRNIILEHRFPNEMPDRFRSMSAELVALKVDVLVTVGTQTAPYARDATTSIQWSSSSSLTPWGVSSSTAFVGQGEIRQGYRNLGQI